MFKGELAQFAPADLLLFLCHMNKEGVLTVRHEREVLGLQFQRNMLVDAHCEAADRLALAHLELAGDTPPEVLERLRRAREETGLPVSRIMTELSSQQPAPAAEALRIARRETVMRLLLLESGEFQFSEITVDPVPLLPPCDGQGLVMDLVREVDEYREVLRGLCPLERRPVRTPAGLRAAQKDGGVATMTAERLVLRQAGSAGTVAALLDAIPLPRHAAARAVDLAFKNGWLTLSTAADRTSGPQAEPAGITCFAAYRRSLRRLLQAEDRQQRVRELLLFAQAHGKVTVLLVLQAGALRRATVYYRDPAGRLAASDFREPPCALEADQVFRRVVASGAPFIGAVFASPLLKALEADASAADCAILPLGALGQHELVLYTATAEPSPAAGPLACLELLCWQLRRPGGENPAIPSGGPRQETAAPRAGDEEAASTGGDLDRMVAAIKDLPPMPQVIVRILDLLGDPDCRLSELTAALAQDPALVARLIKVSNSSLYGGGQSCGSLNQAIVRLGTRTTRSVVVAASTRSLFPDDGSPVGLLGRRLWRHAVQTGLAARRVAEFLRRCDPDEAFAGGVLHDLGKLLILLNQPDAACAIERDCSLQDQESPTIERRILGFDHTEVGERLLRSWSMPESLTACVRWHHRPEAAGAWQDLARVVACGDLLSHAIAAGEDHGPEGPDPCRQEHVARRLESAGEALGLDEGARADLLELLALDLEQDDLLD